MTTDEHGIETKIRIYQFHDSSWVEMLTGSLELSLKDKIMVIEYDDAQVKLPPGFPSPTIGIGEVSRVEIPFSFIRDIEEDKEDSKIAYFWIGLSPVAISFLSKSKCTQVVRILMKNEYRQLELSELQESDQINEEYISHLIETNPSMASILFANDREQIIDLIYQQLRKTGIKQQSFIIFKNAIKLSSQKMLAKLIEGDNFELLLKVLRLNPFNDKNFDYWEQYKKIAHTENILHLEDPKFIEYYQTVSKVRFLKDCAACMFIEIETERNMLNIINKNNIQILNLINSSPNILKNLKKLGFHDPIAFLNIFTELWEIYKSVNCDIENKSVKVTFREKIIEKKLHCLSISAASRIVNDRSLMSLVCDRFHEKWMDALTTFFNSDWGFADSWILNACYPQTIPEIAITLLYSTTAESLTQNILIFIRNILEPNDHRMKPKNNLISMIFKQFVSKLWKRMQVNNSSIETYLKFMMQVYKFHPVFTRWALIEDEVMEILNEKLFTKTILINIIKMLQTFMEESNDDIFKYLRNHQYFKGLNEEYFRNLNSSNMINSCFRSLLKYVQVSESDRVHEYFQIIFPDKNGSSR